MTVAARVADFRMVRMVRQVFAPNRFRIKTDLPPTIKLREQRQSGCDERDNHDEKARLDFGMIVAV